MREPGWFCWEGVNSGGDDPRAAAEATIARIRQEWAPVIAAVVSDSQGDTTAAQQLDRFLAKLGEQGEWQGLQEFLARVRGGEREPISLLAGLDSIDMLIAQDILGALGVPLDGLVKEPEVSADQPSAASGLAEGEATIARIRQEWAPVIAALVSDSQGDRMAGQQLDQFLAKLGDQEEWQNLASILRRVRAGERDPLALLHELDAVDALIAGDVLGALGVALPGLLGGEEASPEELFQAEEPSVHGDQVTLDQFLAMVVQASSHAAPPGLAEQLYGAARGMAGQPDASPEIQALGQVLVRVLMGDRKPDLSGLSAGLSAKIQAMLGALGQR